MRDYLQLIDTHTSGPRCDVTPLFADHAAFSALVEDLVACLDGVAFDCVAGIDALGFILGTALAWRTSKGLVSIRKGGKLPVAVDRAEFVDYTGQCKALEMRLDAIRPGTRVLLVDEWIETGAQVGAAAQLIERQGGAVTAIVTINVDDNPGTRALREKYLCCAVWQDGII